MDAKETTQILVVEDDADDSYLLSREIKRAQIEEHVTVMTNGQDALDFLTHAETLPLAIFLDLHLPGLSGIELLRRLRTDPRLDAVPVMVMTGSVDPKDMEECMRLGVTAYLTKPIKLRSFIKTVTDIFPKASIPD